jgi:hypothetical protein
MPDGCTCSKFKLWDKPKSNDSKYNLKQQHVTVFSINSFSSADDHWVQVSLQHLGLIYKSRLESNKSGNAVCLQ